MLIARARLLLVLICPYARDNPDRDPFALEIEGST